MERGQAVLITEKSCLGHGKGWVDLHALYHSDKLSILMHNTHVSIIFHRRAVNRLSFSYALEKKLAICSNFLDSTL